ncbi:hypothetical protein CJ026_025645 [Ralstonia pickettii]|uniref:hypothetical protein n=1 Tax=Ralstonia pickettii TaxID=329 RepID=UPI000CD53D15|nr:hypothetical protein CJ026_025645 [Ralstonia pickettii]
MPEAREVVTAALGEYDFREAYVRDLDSIIDIAAIKKAGVRIGADPLGGASVDYWALIAGEEIVAKLSHAPGNGAAIGGLKVVTEHAWFAARRPGGLRRGEALPRLTARAAGEWMPRPSARRSSRR